LSCSSIEWDVMCESKYGSVYVRAMALAEAGEYDGWD
jgi:hypothetical protein